MCKGGLEALDKDTPNDTTPVVVCSHGSGQLREVFRFVGIHKSPRKLVVYPCPNLIKPTRIIESLPGQVSRASARSQQTSSK